MLSKKVPCVKFFDMKKSFKILGIVVLVAVLYLGYTNYPKLDLISGFSAKSMASAHFIDGRSKSVIEQGDNDIPLVKLATNQLHKKKSHAIASVFGLKTRKAIYRNGLGATLIDDSFDVHKPYLMPKRTPNTCKLPYPYGTSEAKDSVFSNINYPLLQKTVANAFDVGAKIDKRSRAVLVIYKDHIIAERYSPGFSKNSKLLGWSMTKSLTATYFGILKKQRKINLNAPVSVPEWKNDKRAKITLNDLLHMNSGLAWEEQYDKICDATQMLFQARNMGRVQLEKQAAFAPNTHWNYSSGTTNLLSLILRNQFKSHQDYLDFWYNSLIDKIGMESMLVETDMAGNYVGSSYGWATTRDWAKLGLLYLHRGNWYGEQLFDPAWASYVSTPTATSQGNYGAHFWLNAGGKFPDVPKNMYYASGFQGQMVAIFPGQDLVVVRLGLREDDVFDFNGLLSGIVKCIK